MNIKLIIKKLFYLLNNFLYASSLRKIDFPKDISCQEEIEFNLKGKQARGWYMLEIEARSTIPRLVLKISIDNFSGKKLLNFPVYSGKLCKRIIFLDEKSSLKFSTVVKDNEFSILQFRLLRVQNGFSRSRILTKLQALHPQYKASAANFKHKGEVDHLCLGNIQTLWTDYCKIFDDSIETVSYPSWVREFEKYSAVDNKQLALAGDYVKIIVSVVMPVHNPNIAWLKAAIESVKKQTHPYWELCIADDASTNSDVRVLLARYAKEDKRIKVVFREKNGHISAASNSALSLVAANWVALLDHDDLLAETALFWIADTIRKNPNCRLIYSDEDKIDETGRRSEPYFKSEWNQDLFYSQNMFSHLGVYYTELLREVGGFRVGFEGSQDYDLALRCTERISPNQIRHIPRVLYHWRIHVNSTANGSDVKPYAMVAGTKALNEHLKRNGIAAEAESVGYGYRIKYLLPPSPPLISLIIPTRNCFDLLRRCVNSILNKTNYNPFEIIIIDNGSDDATTLQFLEKLALNPLIRVLRDDRPFNYSALNNAAVKIARGELIGLINNDIEVINADWLSEMVSHALRPGVAAVGARLWYSDDTLQHAGVVLGIHGIAGHVHRFLPRHDVGYCGRASLIQSFSAVTAACLVVRKSIYEELGGLNETELQVACNDVDFCLRAREAGYKNIWTPYAELYHHESSSRGFDDTPEKQARSAKEVAYMKQRWGDALLNDPAYNPNLTLDSEDFGLAWPPRVPSLDEVLSAMEQAGQASTPSSPPTLQ